MAVDVERATDGHARLVADNMRQADVAELAALSGESPFNAALFSVQKSDFSFYASVAGEPLCIFGVGSVSLLGRVGAPWLLGTDKVSAHYREFARGSQMWIERFFERYDVMMNLIDDRNEMTKRWLAWLGAEFSEPIVAGVQRRPFRVFELRAG